jgi:hypothetical protein
MNISIQHSDSLLERERMEEDGEWRENGGREERPPQSVPLITYLITY